MKRRQFIGLSAYLAAVITLPVLESCSGNGSETAIAEPSTLIRILDKKNITVIGQKYLGMFPEENDRQKLVDLLVGKNAPADNVLVRAQLDKQCTADFNSNNTIIVNGWVLALTEARQCALFIILQS